jgi:hypothetical protein
MLTALKPNTFELLPASKSVPYFGRDEHVIRYGVPGDGTCFFYSLCAIINHKNYMYSPEHKQVEIGRAFRCSFTSALTVESWRAFCSKAGYKTNVKTRQELKKKFCSASVWADEPVIRYVMEKLKLNLVFLDDQGKQLYCGVHRHRNDPTGVVLWIKRMHFEPLGRINALDVDNDNVAVQMLFTKKDAETRHHIMDTMEQECNVSLK